MNYEQMLDTLRKIPEDAKPHFLTLVTYIAECYLKEYPTVGVLLILNTDVLEVMPLGAGHEETLEILTAARKVVANVDTSGKSADTPVH